MNARPQPTVFLPMTPALRRRIEEAVERLIGLLDEIDGDADLEPYLAGSKGDDREMDVDLEADG